jgi:hypothetical protein
MTSTGPWTGSGRSYHGLESEYKSISRRFGRSGIEGMMEWMRRTVLAAVALALAAPAVAATGSGRPHVWLADRSPATVRGASFKPAERVAVTLSADDVTLHKTVPASATGAFVARWSRSVPSGCVATGIVARGSEGSRAVYKLSPPDCAPLQPVDR